MCWLPLVVRRLFFCIGLNMLFNQNKHTCAHIYFSLLSNCSVSVQYSCNLFKCFVIFLYHNIYAFLLNYKYLSASFICLKIFRFALWTISLLWLYCAILFTSYYTCSAICIFFSL